MPPVLLAVDGNSLVHRAFHSRAGAGLSSDPVWAVRGLLTQLVAAVERVGADAVLVGFDDPGDSIRRRPGRITRQPGPTSRAYWSASCSRRRPC